MEAAVDEEELVGVNELKLDVKPLAIYIAIERQLVLGRALKRKVAFRVPDSIARKRKSLSASVDRGAVVFERIVRPEHADVATPAESNGGVDANGVQTIRVPVGVQVDVQPPANK